MDLVGTENEPFIPIRNLEYIRFRLSRGSKKFHSVLDIPK